MNKHIYKETNYTQSEITHYCKKSNKNIDGYLWKCFIKKTIEDYGPYKFFATLSFQRPLNPLQTIEFGKQVMRSVIKATIGKRSKQRRRHPPVEGIAVLEMARLFEGANEGGHFHFLLKDHPNLPCRDEDAIAFLTRAFKDATARLKLANPHRGRRSVVESTRLVSPVVGVDVRYVYSQSGIAGYISKQVDRSDWDFMGRFFFLNDPEGLSIWKPKNSVATATARQVGVQGTLPADFTGTHQEKDKVALRSRQGGRKRWQKPSKIAMSYRQSADFRLILVDLYQQS